MALCHLLCFALLALTAQATALNSHLLSDLRDDACSGCEFTVDLRCAGIRSQRNAPYHRIQDCLLPLYGLIKIAENISSIGKSNVCAITWLAHYEGLSLEQFLTSVSGVKWHKIIDERESCASELEYHAVNRTEQQMARADFAANFGHDKKLIKAYPINLTWNLQRLQLDAQHTKAPSDPQIVIFSRRHAGGSGRSFRPAAFEDLRESMHSGTGIPVTTYTGKERVLDTVKLFQQATGFVGYHGAGWVNTYFATRPHCNVQISTFYDLESKVPWRISKELMINPYGSWYFYFLPLNMLLDSNHVRYDAYSAREEKDHFIKDLDWIPLRGVDVADLTSHMVECIVDPNAYSRSHPTPDRVNAAQGWNISSVPSSVARYMPSGKRFSATRSGCTGCDVTVDLRCDGLRYGRHNYFNQLVHCLLPMYEMVQLAREAGSNKSTHVCAITWNGTDGLGLEPFLTDLADVKWHKIIDEASTCARSSLYYAANRTYQLGATETYLNAFGKDSNMIQAYPIDLKLNLGWMQEDAVNIAGRPSPTFVLLQNVKLGMFPPDGLQLFQTKIAQYMRNPVSVYYGTESVRATVELFTNAGGIIGYCGTSWANGLFASYPHCNVQYSTWRDFNKTAKWTINNISGWNPLGSLQYVHLPLRQLLEGNNYTKNEYTKSESKEAILTKLKWIPVTYDDVIAAMSWLYPCWQNKWVAYRRIQAKWGQTGNNLEIR